MSSVSSSFKQCLTRTFVITQSNSNGEWGPYRFPEANIDAWYSANSSAIVKTGSVYIIPGTASGKTFNDVLLGEGGATQLSASGNFQNRKTLIDLGKEVVIGTPSQPRLIVLRRVAGYADSANPNNSAIVYIIVENNTSDVLDGDNGRFMVRCARV